MKREQRRFEAQLAKWKEALSPRLPEIPLHDLDLIVRCILRSRQGGRRWLLREVRPGAFAL